MNFSDYFVKVAEISRFDKEAAEKILREVENYSLPYIANHMILCAKAYLWYLNDADNAIRCLLEAECNNSDDTASLLELATAYKLLELHQRGCERCIKKAVAAAKNEEDRMRLQEFFAKYSDCKQITEGLNDA